MQITQEQILKNSNGGLIIYSYILSLYYPGEIVICLKGTEWTKTKNPFNMHRKTLCLIRVKDRFHHYDTDKAIPSGDVFLFAGMHFGLTKDALYERMNQVILDIRRNKRIGR